MKKITFNPSFFVPQNQEKVVSKSILTISIIFIMFLFINSCGINVPALPALAIYKTNSDYFDNYNAQVDKHGDIFTYRQYSIGDSRICIFEKDTIYALRVKLDSGYVLSAEVGSTDVFTGLKIKDIVRDYSNGNKLTRELIKTSIIDENPFISFYSIDAEDAFKYYEEVPDYPSPLARYLALQKRALELNQEIKNGNLDNLFHKIR